MSGAQWAVPIVLGLAAAGLTWSFAPDEIHIPRPQGTVEVRTDVPYVLVPLDGTPAHDATLLRYNASTTRHGLGTFLDIHGGQWENGTLAWDGTGWECRRPAAAPCPPHQATVVAVDARHVAGPGRVTPLNATADLTFFMFTSSGHLLATNTLRSQWDHFDLHGEFTRFSATTWHLGEGAAPPGARTLPMFRAEAMALLHGTPVGGVQSTVLETHPYDWLVGPVWVTVRVDGLA